MKVCLVSQEYPSETARGGIGTQTLLKARGLSGRGHEVHILTSSKSGESKSYSDNEVQVHCIPAPPLNAPGYEKSTYWLAYSTAVASALSRLCQDVTFDVIQFPDYGGEGFIFQTDTFQHRSARYVVQLHGPLAMFVEHVGWPKAGSAFEQIGSFMERMVIHHADRVLASSRNTAIFTARRYEYPLDKITVIHSGIDTILFRPLPQENEEDNLRILFVGNVSYSKGITVLTNAVLNLKSRFSNLHLRIIGRSNKRTFRKLTRILEEANATSFVEILGPVPYFQLPHHYAWCDMLVAPSAHEPGPGNVYLEAMACGKPVVACNSGGTPEVVLNGKTGILVPPGSVEAVASAIAELAEDAELSKQMGRNGRKCICENFSLERYTDKVEQIYQELIA